MARNREKHNLTYEIKTALDAKLAIGQSKHQDKILGKTAGKIYSWETYRGYMKHCNYFAQYCKQEHGCKTLADCRPYVDEWLQSLIDRGQSAYTQKLGAAAVAKLYGCSTKDFGIRTDARLRPNVVRSRTDGNTNDKNFSEEKNKDFVEFCRSTGLRRHEVKALRGDQLLPPKDGVYRIAITGKGGRYREAPVIGNIDLVVRLMTAAGADKVFSKAYAHADIHSYRADYATAIYKAHARPIDQIPYDKTNAGTGRKYQGDVYCCQKDRKGLRLDRAALLEASRALGHNRVSVVAEHYLYDLK